MNSPMQPDLDALAQLAEAATPGPWTPADIYGLVSPTQIDGYAFPQDREDAKAKIAADRAFIAACDPATVTALVQAVRDAEAQRVIATSKYMARAEAAEQRVAESEDLAEIGFKRAEFAETERDRLRDLFAELKEAHKVTARERDRLRAEIEALADECHSETWPCPQCATLRALLNPPTTGETP